MVVHHDFDVKLSIGSEVVRLGIPALSYGQLKRWALHSIEHTPSHQCCMVVIPRALSQGRIFQCCARDRAREGATAGMQIFSSQLASSASAVGYIALRWH